MNKKLWLLVLAVVVLAGLAIIVPCLARGGEMAPISGYKVLAPIRHGNLTIFPVVAAMSHDTQQFLTLDEGLRSGEVIVTESGNAQPLVRPRHQHSGPIMDGRPSGGAQVNQLVLINNSQRPLILLAGEIVAGGHQDRVIGKDRIVPAESDPIDLSVFCVEPGRWTGPTSTFGGGVGSGGAIGAGMAQPAVRSKAMVDKDQAKVWAEVGKAKESVSYGLSAPAASAVAETSSYARVMQNGEVKQKVGCLGRAHAAGLSKSDPAVARPQSGGSGGRGKRRNHLGRHFRQHRSFGKVLAQTGAVLRRGSRIQQWEQS